MRTPERVPLHSAHTGPRANSTKQEPHLNQVDEAVPSWSERAGQPCSTCTRQMRKLHPTACRTTQDTRETNRTNASAHIWEPAKQHATKVEEDEHLNRQEGTRQATSTESRKTPAPEPTKGKPPCNTQRKTSEDQAASNHRDASHLPLPRARCR